MSLKDEQRQDWRALGEVTMLKRSKDSKNEEDSTGLYSPQGCVIEPKGRLGIRQVSHQGLVTLFSSIFPGLPYLCETVSLPY